MRIPSSALPAIRTAILAVVTAVSVFVFFYFWTNVGGKVPFVTSKKYQVSFDVSKVDNLVPNSDVTMAGIKAGKVISISPTRDGKAHVVLGMNENYAPLHRGVTAKIKAKTLVEETFVDLRDGGGTKLADGAGIPQRAVTPAVQLDDVLRTLDKPHRQALSATLRSLGTATDGTRTDISGALQGLGDLSREGDTALDALADQSSSLRELSANTARVLSALDTREGQIAKLVSAADTVTRTTAGNADQIRAIMRRLPGVLGTARNASGSLSTLAGNLGPVARNLQAAAPSLNTALVQLPQTTANLRSLLPALDQTLQRSPATLQRTPQFSRELTALLPDANRALADINPMLAYIKPYGRDIATFFTSFGLTIARGDANGTMLRVMPVVEPQSLKNIPVNINSGPLRHYSPYPLPNKQRTPLQDAQPYPVISRAPLKGN